LYDNRDQGQNHDTTDATEDDAEHVGYGEDDDDNEDGMVEALREGLTFEEEDIDLIADFLMGVRYQVQFQDQGLLNTLEREGVSSLLHKEKGTRRGGEQQSTWDKSTASAVFYRPRPRAADLTT
jgi:hypothetical protein